VGASHCYLDASTAAYYNAHQVTPACLAARRLESAADRRTDTRCAFR
jgi:hypothetical protein